LCASVQSCHHTPQLAPPPGPPRWHIPPCEGSPPERAPTHMPPFRAGRDRYRRQRPKREVVAALLLRVGSLGNRPRTRSGRRFCCFRIDEGKISVVNIITITTHDLYINIVNFCVPNKKSIELGRFTSMTCLLLIRV
jgi:hypothetical protein